MNKWFKFSAKAGGKTAEVTIFGDIGYGYTANDFHKELSALGDIKTLHVKINSHGGDVFQGFQIYNMLKRFKGTVVVTIDGLAASMGSVIAMAGDRIIMPENSQMMIHNPVGAMEGGADQIKSFGEALENIQANIVQAYVDKTGLPKERIQSMMDKESWLSAKQAVNLGFADEIEEPIQIAASAYNLSRYRNVPKNFGTQTGDNDMADKKREDAIKRICALAGKSDLADGFIKDESKSAEDVMAALEATKQTEDATARATQAAVDAALKAAAGGKKEEPGKVDEAAIRAQVLAEHGEITALCDLAGMPEKANGFIVAGKSVKDVRNALVEAKKADGEDGKNGKTTNRGSELNARRNHRPEGGKAEAIDTFSIWDKFNKQGKKASA